MSNDIDQVGGETDDLDRRLRASATSADDALMSARIRNRVTAAVEGSGQLRRASWRPRLLTAFAVLVPAAAAVAIAGIVLLGPARNVGVVQVPGGGSPSVAPSPLPPAPTPSPVESSPSPVSLTGFQPHALSALSESSFWVLGCPAGSAASALLHTTDGGAHFAPVGQIPAAAAACVDTGPKATRELRFADPTNAWIRGGDLWSTHDGGASWNSVNIGGSVDQLEPGAQGRVYAVINQPSGSRQASYQVMRTLAKADKWAPVTIPGSLSGRPTIGVHGTSLWVMDSAGQTGTLWVSRDQGSTFTRYTDPCSGDLGGSLSPASDTVIWAFCATGMQGHPLVSIDGGKTFKAPSGNQSFNNSTSMAALTPQKAFLLAGDRSLVRTVDAGTTYQTAIASSATFGPYWVGFTDNSVGYVLAVDAGNYSLRRTADGGQTWTEVSFH